MKKFLLLTVMCVFGLFTLNAQETSFSYNFDDGTFAGWRTFDADGAYCLGWQISPDDPILGSYYHGTDGTKCAVSVSANPLYGDTYKPNSYLVTEGAYQITSSSVLSWNMKTPFASSAEYYEVVVSSDNNTFSSIWSEEKNNVNSMTAKEVSLAEYAGQTLYIGFRHYRETSNANAGFLCIDDVVLSSEGGVEPEPQAPSAPANLVAQATGETTIALTWDAVEGATTYKVYDEEDVIAETNETSYTVENLTAATEYCFIVTAVNEVGESLPSAQDCATTNEQQGENPDTAQTITIGADGTTESNGLPVECFYSYSISQQIYTAAEMNYAIGDITKVAFYSLTDVNYTRNLEVYMLNTDAEIFEGYEGMIPVTNENIVFEGELTTPGANKWFEIELQNPFTYTGGNLLVCLIDKTGSYEDQLYFKTFDIEADYGDEPKGVSVKASNDYDPYNIQNISTTWSNPSKSRNTVQFTIVSEPGLTIIPKDGINLGTIQLGEYWPEKAEASVNVTVSAIERTVTSITIDNDFFVLSEIDLTAKPITFTVGYDKEATDGEYTGTLTVTAAEGDVLEVPMTAVVYTPVEPDVFELATEMTFTNNVYTNAPDFTTLHDDYVLPNEGENGAAPDAVYTFTLEEERVIKAGVEGEGGFYAIYRADSIGEGKGPQANNNYNGTETVLSTTFEYNFDDNSLDAFTMINYDEYPEHCWVIENGELVSYSYKGWNDENGNYVWISDADERLIMNTAYTITPNSVLTFDIAKDQYAWENITIEVTQDGENFVALGTVYRNDYVSEWTEGRVDVGSAFIAACLAYGDYQIVLHHDVSGAGTLKIDNLKLTERAGVYEAGDYYLVAAAKEAFTLNVELKGLDDNEEPIDPVEPKDYRLASITGMFNTTYTYESEESDKVVEINADGLIDALEYNEEGLLIGYTSTYEGSTDIINDIDFTYEDGKLVGYAETAQSMSGPITQEFEFAYNDEGQVITIVSPDMTTQFTYNAEGLVSEKLTMYGTDIDSKEVYEYENGRLVELSYYGYDWWEAMDFYLAEVNEYEYDENGNCTFEKQYLVNDDESLSLFYVNEYSYNETVAYNDVFYFEYPHLALLNPAKPSHNNIITREFSYYQYMDGEEVIKHSEVETLYHYNPELPSDEPEPAAQVIVIGADGAGLSESLPVNTFYGYSLSQQIYTGAEMNYTVGDISKIAFKQVSTDNAAPITRDVVVYMLNTEKAYFETWTDWIPVSSADIVYEGDFTTGENDSWIELELQTPFAYAGGNFLICVHDLTGSYKDRTMFQTFEVTPEVENTGRTLANFRDAGAYNISNLVEEYGNISTQCNTVQFTISSEPGLTINPKDGINLGTIQLGEYWPEKAEASAKVTVGAVERTVASITTDNDFFVLSEIDLTATPITFTVGYDKEAAAGTYNGTLTVTAEEGDVLEVPMTAVVYNPVEPDVFELAREISFTNNAYTDTPDFTTLHDDYKLPGEGEDGSAPDAVYTFTLTSEKVITAEVEGESGFYAIYKADSIGNGNGPKDTNNYKGVETILSTTFEYNFDDNSIEDFTTQNLDEYEDYCWYVEDGKLISKSFDSWGEYGTDSWGMMNQADERIITKEAYTITPYTVLSFDMQRIGGSYQNLTVEVTKDGENFTALGTVTVDPDWVDDPANKPMFPDLFDENGNYISFRRVDLGANFIAAGLEYGEYQISLHAVNSGCEQLIIDDLALTERAGVYEAGDYYLVAAAKEAFTLNVELQDLGDEPGELHAPTNITAVATSANSILLSWDAVEGAAGYGVYCDGEWLAGFYNTVLEYEFVGYFDPETTYCFAMTTITEIDAEGYIVGETEPSDDVCATTEASSVLPPTNVVAEAISDTEIRLSWDAADGALGYGIYKDGQFAGAIQETSIVFDQLAPDTEYCFAVFSVSEIDAEGFIVGFSATSDEVCATTVGVAEFSTAFNIYPNPVNDVLFIENGCNIEQVTIYNVTGVMVYSEECTSNNVQVNVSDLEAGVYIIRVKTENNEVINRFVKK